VVCYTSMQHVEYAVCVYTVCYVPASA